MGVKIFIIYFILIFQATFYVEYCNAKCKTVSSLEHGKLFLQKTEKMNPKCLGNFMFENMIYGEKFCLKKSAAGKDKMTCESCTCGQNFWRE